MHLDLALTHKPLELVKFYEVNEKGIDFWGDKENSFKPSAKLNENLPLKVIYE